MVFENLTLVEIQLDGAQFGRRTMNDDASADHGSTGAIAHGGSGGPRRRLPAFLLAGLAIVAAVRWHRRRSADVDTESEAAEADLASAR